MVFLLLFQKISVWAFLSHFHPFPERKSHGCTSKGAIISLPLISTLQLRKFFLIHIFLSPHFLCVPTPYYVEGARNNSLSAKSLSKIISSCTALGSIVEAPRFVCFYSVSHCLLSRINRHSERDNSDVWEVIYLGSYILLRCTYRYLHIKLPHFPLYQYSIVCFTYLPRGVISSPSN